MTDTLRRLKRQRDAREIDGFTLLEILIVIVVLGILAAVVIFALSDITGKTAVAACQADGTTVATAMADFNNQNGNTAVSTAGLINGTVANGKIPYIQSWPNNTPHYGFVLGTGPTGGTAGTAGTLYVVTGSVVASGAGTVASPYVYATSADNGSLTTGEVAAALTSGGTVGIPALIPYSGPWVCSAATTVVS
jgi:general secretion pathway protein G